MQADKSGAKASSNTAAASSAQAGKSSAALSSGTTTNAALSQPVDAKKNKPGDQVTAKTTEATKSEGKVVIPKGAKLVGHVTECKQRSKEQKESALGIVFDKAILKNGEEIPLNVTIRALAAAQTAASSSYAGDDLAAGGAVAGSGRAASGGALGGVRSTAGAAAGAAANTAANVGGVESLKPEDALAVGRDLAGRHQAADRAAGCAGCVHGGVRRAACDLNAVGSNTTQGSLITSTSKNVHLDSGTQLLLVSQAQASTDTPKP